MCVCVCVRENQNESLPIVIRAQIDQNIVIEAVTYHVQKVGA